MTKKVTFATHQFYVLVYHAPLVLFFSLDRTELLPAFPDHVQYFGLLTIFVIS